MPFERLLIHNKTYDNLQSSYTLLTAFHTKVARLLHWIVASDIVLTVNKWRQVDNVNAIFYIDKEIPSAF